jgi:hypothetical protein
MTGAGRRKKGQRAEYLVRDDLREKGYKADRVPLSGASEGFKGDVIASKDGDKFVFEVKSRKNEFKSIFEFFFSRKDKDTDTYRFYVGDNLMVAMSRNFEAIKKNYSEVFKPEPETKVTRKILRIKSWLQGADFLVIKNNGSSLLYLKYFDA